MRNCVSGVVFQKEATKGLWGNNSSSGSWNQNIQGRNQREVRDRVAQIKSLDKVKSGWTCGNAGYFSAICSLRRC